MKLLLAGLFLFSTSVFAAFEGPDEIRAALRMDLDAVNYDCKWDGEGIVNEDAPLQLLGFIDNEKTVFTVNKDKKPVLVTGVLQHAADDVVTINFFISSDLKHVTRVDVLRESLSMVRANTGTITEPEFKDVTTREVTLDGSCKVLR